MIEPEGSPSHSATIIIDRLGAQGDGIADVGGMPIFVPFALPGETWTRIGAAASADVGLVADPHPARQAPVCPHFGRCGGCVAQHMGPDLYGAWKRGIVIEAFRQRGLQADVAQLLTVAAHSRRRATFTARRVNGTVTLGFHGRATHDVCDIGVCPVLAPPIEAALPALRALSERLLPRSARRPDGSSEIRLAVTLARDGLDVAITGAPRLADPNMRREIAAAAADAHIRRLTADGEPVLAGRAPVVDFAGVAVGLPDRGFLQAVVEAETALRRLVVEGVGTRFSKTGVVADLFCGLGTFTFALARKARVLALDGDKTAIDALSAAARQAQGIKPIEARRRDLFREPLAARELSGIEAAVLDPPRAGAAAQVASLAASKVPRVVMVSCNPATLARDCRTLADGGYELGTVTPVDQFLFSAHVEVVAVLTR